jgi:hypothetical protein
MAQVRIGMLTPHLDMIGGRWCTSNFLFISSSVEEEAKPNRNNYRLRFFLGRRRLRLAPDFFCPLSDGALEGSEGCGKGAWSIC